MNGLVDRVRAGRAQLLMLLAFLGLAVLLLGSTWGSPTTRTLGGGVGDPGIFTWSLRWTPFAIGRQISPLFSDYLNHPDGINLMWNTWVPLPGLLLSPLTLAFGPVLSFNVLLTLAYGLSAWSAYLAIHRYVPNHGAAAAGGLVYGFSPAMVGHSHHLNLILIFLLPWLLVLVEEIVARQDRSPVWLGLALGVAAAAQVLIGVELFAAAVLLGGLLLVATALVVLAFLAPSSPLQPRPVVATPPFFTTSAVTTLPRDEVALVVPFPQKGRANRAMLWQTEAGMWFKMPGGYFVGPGPDGAALREAPPSTTSLALGHIQRGGRPPDLTPALRRRMAEDFARWRVRSVVLGPMPHRRAMAGFLSDLLGRAPERTAGVELWAGATVAASPPQGV